MVLSFLLRLPFLTVALITDEGGYAYVARRWLEGQGTLYEDLWFDRPQGIFLAYGLVLNTLGTDVVAIRLGGWLVSALTLLVVWGFTRDAAGQRVAGLAAVLCAVIAASPLIEGFTANAEVFMALPAAGCAWALLRASRNGWRVWSALAAGFLAGVAALLKPSGIVMLPVGLTLVWLLPSAGVVTVVRRWAWLTTGFALALAPAILHGWLGGWDEFVHAVTYRVHHRSLTTVPPLEQLGRLALLIGQVWPLLVAVALPLGVRHWLDRRSALHRREGSSPVSGGARRWVRRRATVAPGREGEAVLSLWLIGACVGVAMGGNWFPHYLIQLAAPLAIWLAAQLLQVVEWLSTRAYRSLIVVVAVALLAPYGVVAATGGDADELSTLLFDRQAYPIQDEIAAYIRARTAPDAPIYVAFAQASIYYLADRPAAYRHLYMWELQAVPDAEQELVAMVESPFRPVYIVDMEQEAPFDDGGAAFWAAVRQHYHLEAIIGGLRIYRANERSGAGDMSANRKPLAALSPLSPGPSATAAASSSDATAHHAAASATMWPS